jgi:hypothetical protein
MIARLLGLVAVGSFTLVGLVGCSGDVADDTGTANSELVTLTAQQCNSPAIATAPLKDSAGRPIFGTARTTVDGCILGKAGETGEATLVRAKALLNDTARFGTITDSQDKPIFSQFRPQAASGVNQEVDVTLNASFNPSTRLRVTRQDVGGAFNVKITNVTPVKATITFFSVTAVKPNGLSLDVKISPESNGIKIVGAGEVTLEQQKERAEESAQLVKQVHEWLTEELAR